MSILPVISTRCCIAGGGPAGMMLGYLLARAGVDVVVLEKHADFLRDFRGDTIHPSTLEVMHELGIIDTFLKQPHDKVHKLTAYIGDSQFRIADFSCLPVKSRYIAMIPQWDFLNFIASEAKRFPHFQLKMQAQVSGLIEENGMVKGAYVTTPEGVQEIRAGLTIGADGRHSTVREKAGLKVKDIGAPIDVLWMRLPRLETDPAEPIAKFDRGQLLVMLYRGDYWQCAYVIPKNGHDTIRAQGLPAFRARLVELMPILAGRVDVLADWEQIKLLTVTVDRLISWSRPGLLCIGDAAHAMSPVGGVGINLAIQDAVAAANILAVPLRNGTVTPDILRQVQKRRELPTKLTQLLQVVVQNRIIGRVISNPGKLKPGPFLRFMLSRPLFARLPARIVGMGFRPEHIRG